ncbi:MAG: hypothetical protein K5790_03620 [Nitrosopumilus sp.]|uniref:hypothetical protein n=1 Tax=Nitrosopumilus sp. TaxID=2024843 RepID=UPI00247B97DD|nr:hypothetical protein [Nitrosopumilus sp.]MCV0392368.1 hypothetical protein [Nitrosopumilus sp.]
MSTEISKSKEMKDLMEKEKKLHKEISTDFKKISSKITEDIEFVKKSKSIK